MKKILLAVALSISLSGCLTIPVGHFENRVACTVAKDRAFVVSEFGPVGVSNIVSIKDTAFICK